MNDPLRPHEHRVGDKVRIRAAPRTGERGVIHSVTSEGLEVALPNGDIVTVEPVGLTNYSLAARRAWQTMPKKAGRPHSPGPGKRMVSIRIDAELWAELEAAASNGLIPSREFAVNQWLREQLDRLMRSGGTDDE
jgi:hypothetical protein